MKNIVLTSLVFFLLQNSIFSQIFIDTNADVKCVDNVDLTLVESNFQNNGTLDAGTGTVFFKENNGNSNAKISGNSTTTFNNITLDLQNHDLQLMQAIGVNGTITFSNGNFELNAFNLNLGTNGMISGETENSSFTGITGGSVNISAELNAPNSANPGNLGAIITSAANLGNTTVSISHMENTNGSNVSIKRTYDISPTNNSGLNATLRFQYLDSELNGISESELELWRNDGSGWQNMGFSTRDVSNNFVELTGIDAFSIWTLTNQANALPIELTYFNAIKEDEKTALLIWETSSEFNNEGFEIERGLANSLGVLEWEILDFVAGQGTINQTHRYEFLDKNPKQGLNYYRLRQIDFDRTETFSEIKVLDFDHDEKFQVGAFFPNPQNVEIGEVNLTIENSKEEEIKIQVFDNFSRLIQETQHQLLNGKNELILTTQNMDSGIYHFLIKINEEQIVRKLIIL